MQKILEKIIEKLEEEKVKGIYDSSSIIGEKNVWGKAIEIVKQAAEEYTSTEHINCSSDDLISRSVLNDKLKKWKFANEERGYYTAKDLIQGMIDLVKEQPSVSENNGWIPCSDHLPKENGYYFVTQIVKSISSGKKLSTEKDYVEFSDGKWRRAKYIQVIAWLDIEPYQPKGE